MGKVRLPPWVAVHVSAAHQNVNPAILEGLPMAREGPPEELRRPVAPRIWNTSPQGRIPTGKCRAFDEFDARLGWGTMVDNVIRTYGGVRRPPGPILMLIPCTADFSRRLVLAGEAWDHFSHRRPTGNSEPFDPSAGYAEAPQCPSPGRRMRRRRGADSRADPAP